MNNTEYKAACEDVYGYISDASKDAQGFRTRFNYTELTLVQLCMEADYWSMRVGEAIDEEAARQAVSVVEFEKLVVDTLEMGAADRETAVRWLEDAARDDSYQWDSLWFNFEYDLPSEYNPHTGEVDYGWNYKRDQALAA